MVDKKECPGNFTLNGTKDFVCVANKHDPMQPIECEILKRKILIQNEITSGFSTKSEKPFLYSPLELKSQFICHASEIGINILINSKNFFVAAHLSLRPIFSSNII